MADIGFRSIEVNIRNTTSASFAITSIELNNPGMMRWVPGATPVVGAQLKAGEHMVWAVATDNPDSGAGGRVTLAGPISVSMQIDPKNKITVIATGNDKITAVAEPGGGDPGHGIYKVTLSAKAP
jgi:hypothetical protein